MTLLLLVLVGFDPVVERDGVQVFQKRGVAGVELVAEGELPAPPEQVLRVLIDYANHPKWNAHLAESRILSAGEGFLDVYQRLDLPLLDDRDFTLHVTWKRDSAVIHLRFVTDNARGPAPRRGVVRVSLHEGDWELQPLDGARTRARYHFHLDLAGALPAWMGRGRAARDVPGLFESIRSQLRYYR